MQQLEPPLTALIAAAVELFVAWLIFYVVPKSWRKQRVAAYVIVLGLLLAVNWSLTGLSASGWLARQENASTVQAVSTAAQAMFAVVLIGVAVFTLRANADMARETATMAAVAVQQQQAAIRPVLVFRIHPVEGSNNAPSALSFGIEVFNVGAGPALETRISVAGPIRYAVSVLPVQPLAIAALETVGFDFKFDPDSPFADPSDAMRWPRTPEDAELQREWQAGEDARLWSNQKSPEYERHLEIRNELRRREVDYRKELTARIVALRDVGQIRAEYRDLAGRDLGSFADLLVGPRDASKVLDEYDAGGWLWYEPYWPPITLGPLLLSTSLTGAIIARLSMVADRLDTETRPEA